MKEETIQMSINLSKQERRWLERLCKKEVRTMNQQIRRLIKRYVEEKYPDMLLENGDEK